MPFPISCQACEAAFSIDEALFERRVVGRVVRFKCPSCGARSAIDAVVKDAWVRIGAGTEHSRQRLTEVDLTADEADVAELSDDEVASLPPESLAAAKAARPRPRPRLESKIDDELWVVSVKEGVEDQEIFESSLTELIANGKMPPDAIVWREGIDNWVPLADVPELARHLPATEDKTGGFLGTGMQVSFGSNAGERKSAPPPLPPKKRSYGNSKKKSYGGEGRAKPVALSPGFLFSVDDAESEPPPVVEEARKGGKAVPKPPLKAPRRAVTRDLDFSDIAEDDVIPSSGAPALRDLAIKVKKDHPTPKGPAVFLSSLGGSEEPVLGPPSIDISDLTETKPASLDQVVEQAFEPDEVPTAPTQARSSSAPASKKGKKDKAGRSKPPPSQASAEASARSSSTERASSAAPRERAKKSAQSERALPSEVPEQRGWFTPGRVVVLLAIAALAYFLFSRQMQQPATPTAVPVEPSVPTPAAKAEPVPEPTPAPEPPLAPSALAPTPVESSTPPVPVGTPPSEVAAPGPAAQPRPQAPSDAPAVKERAPETPPAPKPEATPAPKPEPMPANPDSPPFNKDAAVAALNTAVAQAAGCRQEGDPSGTALVVVTFAPSGRVTSANLNGPPFAGTRTGGCIASSMRRAKIPAFSGTHVTVRKSVVIR